MSAGITKSISTLSVAKSNNSAKEGYHTGSGGCRNNFVGALIPFFGAGRKYFVNAVSCLSGLVFQTVTFQLAVEGLAIDFQQLGGLALVLVDQFEDLLDMFALYNPER